MLVPLNVPNLVALVAKFLVVDGAVARRYPVAVNQQSELLLGKVDTTSVHCSHKRGVVHLRHRSKRVGAVEGTSGVSPWSTIL